MNIVERGFINVITSRLRKQLNNPDIQEWILVLDYQTKELYFKVYEKKIYFGDSTDIIKTYIADKYSDYEQEHNRKIYYVMVSSNFGVTITYLNKKTNKVEQEVDKL